FQPKYVVSSDKKKIVSELKKAAKTADKIYLASDHDREGEAIAWHLMETLSLDESKTERIVFHEITKSAIQAALNTPHKIDKKLVDAQQARRVLDRLVGFELSPVLWRKVQPSLSAGRVQSVAVRLIVDKENDIRAFASEKFFKVSGDFLSKDDVEFKADLNKKFKTREEAEVFLKQAEGNKFTVENVDKKPGTRNPAPPFTTSTLQQEASRKLGYSVTQTMRIAQKLYEAGRITYMRTDSLNLSNLALASAKKEITSRYGEAYSKVRNFKTKSKGAQEAHEAIRPTDLHDDSCNGDAQMQKIYALIWKRTIASQMAPATLEKTQAELKHAEIKETFIAKGEVITFDGFIKVYTESFDDDNADKDDQGRLPKLNPGDILPYEKISALERLTKSPARYTEAMLVKKLEELGIGRPSTYAPTISTIQKRGYVLKESREGTKVDYTLLILDKNKAGIQESHKSENSGVEKQKLFPTDIGNLVNKFLLEYFENIVDYNFTAYVEKEFDDIADGKMDWHTMIQEFYEPFHKQITDTLENASKFKGERPLGKDPATGHPVVARIGRFGPMIQIGEVESEEKPRFASLRRGQSIDTISFEEAMELFDYPRSIGSFEEEEMTVAIGRFGPYVKHKSAFFSLQKEQDPGLIGQDEAIELIEAKRKKDIENTIRVFEEEDIKILKGRFGPYISHKKKNYKIVKGTKPEELSLEQCLEIIAKGPVKKGGAKNKAKATKKKA
ncbi:MAG: type I DNA topoisomerase, partial [Candidatus Marinimicrobia bacterium]|nr:type I DNA topoisomerase [Candidatus Neomarinimicrobiota bacterium]